MIAHPNARAFLDLISAAEGTLKAPDPYRVCYGYRHTIHDLSDHPALTGEWTGERLPDKYCKSVGLRPGCKSTAAGAYQIIKPTWLSLRRKLTNAVLPDFGPKSQDEAAMELVRSCHAVDDVLAGRIADAVHKCRRIWASFPGAGHGQPERKLGQLLAAFEAAGGRIA